MLGIKELDMHDLLFLNYIILVILIYLIATFIIRSSHTPKVFLSFDFLFYICAFVYCATNVINCYVVSCEYLCHTIFLSMHFCKISIVLFMAQKLEIYNPNRYLGSDMDFNPLTLKICYFLGFVYTVALIFSLLNRTCSQGPQCVTNASDAQTSVIIFLSGSALEIIFAYKFFRCSYLLKKKIRTSNNSNNSNPGNLWPYWVVSEVQGKISMYNMTSLGTIFTDLLAVLWAAYIISAMSTETVDDRRSVFNVIHFGVGLNLFINCIMVILCATWRNISMYHLLQHSKMCAPMEETGGDYFESDSESIDDLPLGMCANHMVCETRIVPADEEPISMQDLINGEDYIMELLE